MKLIKRLFSRIQGVGIPSTDNFAMKRRKEFYNIMLLLGALVSIPQTILGFEFDTYSGVFQLIWGVTCILSIFIHYYVSFNFARVVTYLTIFIFACMVSARFGAESNSHLASLTIFISIFILHDLKKEWGWILFYFLLECAAIILVESNVWKASNATDFTSFGVRIGYFIGTISFLALEFIYFIRMSMINEQHVTQQLRASNLMLKERNEEKDLLLKEIHHRVKNNLQIISSLLRLQSNEINDEEAKRKFKDSINRIKSISNLHETIYKSDNILNVNMQQYLQNMALNLIASYCIKKNIELEIKSELRKVESDHVVPISLILNELISNSLKHGFSNFESGQITILIAPIKNPNHYRLTYSDSGDWTHYNKSSTFGIGLIQSLVDQLNGTIENMPNFEKSEYSILFEVTKSNRI